MLSPPRYTPFPLPVSNNQYSECPHPLIFRSIVVSMRACQERPPFSNARDPGSIPGERDRHPNILFRVFGVEALMSTSGPLPFFTRQPPAMYKTTILFIGREPERESQMVTGDGDVGDDLSPLASLGGAWSLDWPRPINSPHLDSRAEERGLISIDSLSVHSSAQYLGSVVHPDNHHVPTRALDQTDRDRSHSQTCLYHSKATSSFGHRRW